jgi:membrane-bound serine protease (ClpP class)
MDDFFDQNEGMRFFPYLGAVLMSGILVLMSQAQEVEAPKEVVDEAAPAVQQVKPTEEVKSETAPAVARADGGVKADAESQKGTAESVPERGTSAVRREESKVREFAKGESYADKVVVISVGEEDLMNPAKFEYMSRTLKRASDEGAEAVVIDLDTPGGIAWNTTTMAMEDLQKMRVRTVAFVNPRALSAGALIAMGTDAIYMSPASSIGAATPVTSMGAELGEAERAKMNSALMAMARSAAKAKGHREEVANSMVDKDVGLKIGDVEIVPKGQICSLDQEQATRLFGSKPLLAKAVVASLDELKELEQFKGESVRAEPQGFELVAIWITQYATVLLLIGLAAGYLEMQSPGFGLPGFTAAAAFFLFFFGHYIAGSLVGFETVAIFVLGIGLIVLEFFILPGFLVPGLVGLALVIGALIYTMAGWEFTVPEGRTLPVRLDDYVRPLLNLGMAFVGSIVAILLMMRFLPEVGPFKHMILETAVGGAQASIEGVGQRHASSIQVGALGLTRSALRPYGNVDFDGVTLEAMAEGDYLPHGIAVRVRSVKDGRVVVERAGEVA